MSRARAGRRTTAGRTTRVGRQAPRVVWLLLAVDVLLGSCLAQTAGGRAVVVAVVVVLAGLALHGAAGMRRGRSRRH